MPEESMPTDQSPQVVTTTRPVRSSAIILLLLVSFILGAGGGIFGVALVANSSSLRSSLHLDQSGINLPGTTHEKLVIEDSSAIIDAVKKVQPSVVSIKTEQDVQNIFGFQQTVEGGGTGFVLTEDGLIATSKHVVSDPNAHYTVVTSDGKNYPADIKATDPSNDFAVLKISAKGLQPIELGDSDSLEVGQWLIAIGNALAEFKNTVTVGVLSAKERKVSAASQLGGQSEDLEGLLQTDAAINAGNSGGPLINLKGQVIGINTAVAGSAQNIGFSIPINAEIGAIDSVRKQGKIVRPVLGVRYVTITKDLAQTNNLPTDHGALVIRGDNPGNEAIIPGGPADKAGIQESDIILEINGQPIDDDHSLSDRLHNYKPGDDVSIKLLRKNETKTVTVKLGSSS